MVEQRPYGKNNNQDSVRFGTNFPTRKKTTFHSFCHQLDKKVIAIFERYKVDLAIIHSAGTFDCVRIIAELIRRKVPFAVVNHFENQRLSHPFAWLKLKQAVAIGGVSTINIPEYVKKKFVHVREGIDTQFFQVERARFIPEYKKLSLIFMPARLDRLKGQIDLIGAASILDGRGLKVTIAFAGRTDSKEVSRELSSAAKCLDRGRVMFLGSLDKQRMRTWYATCKIVALPSYSEGLPRVLLEAQSMKRPVIAYDVGGVPQALCHGRTGFVVEKGNIIELADRLQQLLLDKRMRRKMGEIARGFVEKEYSAARSAETHEEIYLKAMGHN